MLTSKPMLGDIVRPLPYDIDTGRGHGPLASGCERYDDAVVVRVSPFALVSRGTDMLWSCTVERADFSVTGQRVTFEHFERCRQRVTYGLTNRRVKRERAKTRKRLAVK